MVFVFIYNILLLFIYISTFALVLITYLKNKTPIFLALTTYLAFYILDEVIIYMTEGMQTFEDSYNALFMSFPIVKGLIFLGNAFCSFWLVDLIAGNRFKKSNWIFLAVMACWIFWFPYVSHSALKVWMFYLPTQLMLIYLGGYCCYKNKTAKNLPSINYFYLKWVGIINIIFGIFILLEDTFVIFYVDEYASSTFEIFNRNICEDIFSIIICALILKYTVKDSENETTIFLNENLAPEPYDSVLDFCQEYQLTSREIEIARLLLNHESNQEIADTLNLSVGTIKTHIHNIFIKLDITRRNQIFEIYQDFQKGLKKHTNVIE